VANRNYCTLDEAKATFGIADSVDDNYIAAAITAASRKIDDFCGRRFYQEDAPTDAYFVAIDNYTAEIDDFWTTTGLVVKVDSGAGTFPTTIAAANYVLMPLDGAGPAGQAGWPFHTIRLVSGSWFPPLILRPYNVLVTANWGWAQIPDEVSMACRLLAHQLYRAKDAPFGAAGISDVASVKIGANPQVRDLLLDYVKRVGIA
jgi:hypothetical protein